MAAPGVPILAEVVLAEDRSTRKVALRVAAPGMNRSAFLSMVGSETGLDPFAEPLLMPLSSTGRQTACGSSDPGGERLRVEVQAAASSSTSSSDNPSACRRHILSNRPP
jgi:hypothetical protein